MYKCNDPKRVPQPMKVVYSPEADANLFYRAGEDYADRDFAKNYGGHPRSDVALLNEQNDLTAVNQILARLQERPGDGSVDATDNELSIVHKSKYCQTASEKIDYYEEILRLRDEQELAEYEGKEKEKKEKELAERRAKLRASLTPEEKEYIRKKQREKDIDDLVNS